MGKAGNKNQIAQPSEQVQLAKIESWNKTCDTLLTAFKWLCAVAMVFIGFYVGIYLPIQASAGKSTLVSYVVNFATSIKLDVILAWGAAVGCGTWASYEKWKRLRERKEKDERIVELERQIDKGRSSSELNVSGEAGETK